MGLFRSESEVDKTVKKLIGGFIMSTEFSDALVKYGIEHDDGEKIRNQIKKEAKEGILKSNQVPKRIQYLLRQAAGIDPDKEPLNGLYKATVTCDKCGFDYAKDLTICPYCDYSRVPKDKPKTVNKKFSPKKSYDKKTKTCPFCKKQISVDLTYCPFCNNDVENFKTCPKCGNVQSDSNTFCISCGFKFSDDAIECPECGNLQRSKNSFCTKCGASLKEKLSENDNSLKDDSQISKKDEPVEINIVESENDSQISKKDEPVEINIVESENDSQISKKDEPVEINIVESDNDSQDSKKEKHSDVIVHELSPYMEFRRKNIFLLNQNHNIKICSDCNTQLLKEDPFCYNCGSAVMTQDTVKNDNLKIHDGKVVSPNESGSDELSKLESLYNQTVQSKYAPSFKIAYVLYLNELKKNPGKKFSDKTAKRYDTTVNKLKKQAVDDEFIETAPPISAAKDSKVTELKEILREHNLKVSGKKDELIQRLGENLSDDELKKYFKAKNYQLSNSGEEFLNSNSPILYIHSNSNLSNVMSPVDINKIFEEKPYSMDEIYDKLLIYLNEVLDGKLTNELWVDFKSYSNAVASVMEDKNDLKEALNIRFKVFLFNINNISLNTHEPNPQNLKLKQKDYNDLITLMHNLGLSLDELKELFKQSYNEVLFKTVITCDDSLIYLLKIFGGEDLESLSVEINESYSNPY